MRRGDRGPRDVLEENVRRLLESGELERRMPAEAKEAIAEVLVSRCRRGMARAIRRSSGRSPAGGILVSRAAVVLLSLASLLVCLIWTVSRGEKEAAEPDRSANLAIPVGEGRSGLRAHIVERKEGGSRSAYAVSLDRSRRVARALGTGIVRARFRGFTNSNQTCWEVTEIVYGPPAFSKIASFNSVILGGERLDPDQLARRSLSEDELGEAHFREALESGWSADHDVILLIAGTAMRGRNGEYLSCEEERFGEYRSYHLSGIIYGHVEDLDAVEREIVRMIETGSYLEGGDRE